MNDTYWITSRDTFFRSIDRAKKAAKKDSELNPGVEVSVYISDYRDAANHKGRRMCSGHEFRVARYLCDPQS